MIENINETKLMIILMTFTLFFSFGCIDGGLYQDSLYDTMTEMQNLSNMSISLDNITDRCDDPTNQCTMFVCDATPSGGINWWGDPNYNKIVGQHCGMILVNESSYPYIMDIGYTHYLELLSTCNHYNIIHDSDRYTSLVDCMDYHDGHGNHYESYRDGFYGMTHNTTPQRFMIGTGSSFYEYQVANTYANCSLTLATKWVNRDSNGDFIPPNPKVAENILENGVIPVYIFDSDWEYNNDNRDVVVEKLKETAANLNGTGPVIFVLEAHIDPTNELNAATVKGEAYWIKKYCPNCMVAIFPDQSYNYSETKQFLDYVIDGNNTYSTESLDNWKCENSWASRYWDSGDSHTPEASTFYASGSNSVVPPSHSYCVDMIATGIDFNAEPGCSYHKAIADVSAGLGTNYLKDYRKPLYLAYVGGNLSGNCSETDLWRANENLMRSLQGLVVNGGIIGINYGELIDGKPKYLNPNLGDGYGLIDSDGNVKQKQSNAWFWYVQAYFSDPIYGIPIFMSEDGKKDKACTFNDLHNDKYKDMTGMIDDSQDSSRFYEGATSSPSVCSEDGSIFLCMTTDGDIPGDLENLYNVPETRLNEDDYDDLECNLNENIYFYSDLFDIDPVIVWAMIETDSANSVDEINFELLSKYYIKYYKFFNDEENIAKLGADLDDVDDDEQNREWMILGATLWSYEKDNDVHGSSANRFDIKVLNLYLRDYDDEDFEYDGLLEYFAEDVCEGEYEDGCHYIHEDARKVFTLYKWYMDGDSDCRDVAGCDD